MLLFLLLLVAGAHCTHFELEGHLTDISVEDVARAPTRRSHFAPAEAKLKNRMEALFKDKMTKFFVEKFEIHGKGVHPTAMFKAYMTVSLSRSEVIAEIADHEHLTIFRLMELDALPLPKKEDDESGRMCSNGGFLLPNNTCVCQNFFSGPSCEHIMCMNQGIADLSGPSCVCPPGFYSTNCEHRGCIPQVNDDINIGGQSFILVLNQKESMSYVLNNLVASIGQILADDKAFYDNYIVVNYVQTDKALYMQSSLFYDIQSLVGFLNSILFTSQGKERQPNNMAAYQAQNFDAFMRPFSNIFVFIDSLDSDSTTNSNYMLSSDSSANQLILKTISWRNRITYMISQSKGSPFNAADPGYDVYRQVSRAALGDIVSYDIQEWKQAMYLMSYYNQNENVATIYNFAVEDNKNISIDQSKDEKLYALLTVDSTGLLPNITNDKGDLTVIQSGQRFILVSTSVADTKFFNVGLGTPWNLRVFTHSKATMLLGYDFNSKTDVGSVYTPKEYNTVLNGAVRNIISTNTTVQWIDTTDGFSLGEPMTASVRTEDCSYPLTMGVPLGSSVLGPFGHKVTMTLSDGSTITRIVPGYSVTMDVQSEPKFVCYNGGTKAPLENVCNCAPLFTGPNCGVPICQNGGSVNNFPGNGFGLCNCPPGYSGDHCTILNCTQNIGKYPSAGSSLSLVVQNTLSQAHISKNISSGINYLISSMKNSQFTDYQLTTFRMEGFQNDIIYAQKSKTQFESAVKSIQYLPSQSTTQDSLSAIVIAVENVNYQNSPMFVFVDSPQSTDNQEENILALVVAKGIQLNMIVTAPFGLPELCMNDSSTGVYQELARKTGGIYVNLCKPYNHQLYPADSISMIFSGYAVSHHGTESVNENFFPIFNEGTSIGFDFYIDQPENDAFFIANCPNTEIFNATLTNSDLKTPVALSTSVSVPFLAVYKLPLLVSSSAVYKISVDGALPPCFLKVVTKSTEALYLNFAQDPSQDVTSQFLGYAHNTHPVVHVSTDRLNLSLPLEMTAYSELSGSGFSYSGTPILRESSCSFELFFPAPLACNYPSNSYVFRLIGTTNSGKKYMRAVRGFCFLSPDSCLNGGQYIALPQPHCDCSREYQGFFCEEPICVNGAESDYFSCDCDAGFTGTFCSHVQCRNWNFMESVDPRSSGMKQITFVLNRNIQNLLVNTQLSNTIWSILLETVGYQTQTLYSLVMFDSKGVQTVASTSNPNMFMQSFQNAVGQNIDTDTTSKTKSIDAINEALKLNIQPPGIIFVFTPNEPADFNPELVDNFLQQRLDTQVNVFYTPPQTAYPTLPESSNTTDLLYQTVKQSGGRFLPLTQNSISTISYMLSSAFNMNGLVYDDAFQDCSTSNSFHFELESAFISVEITITGFDVAAKGKVQVFSNQIQLQIQDENLVFQDNGVLVLVFYNDNFDTFATSGSWAVRVQTTTGACSCQVRVYSDTRVIPGFASNMFNDFVYSLPYTGTDVNRNTYMMYRVTNRDTILAPYPQKQHVFKTNYVTPYSEQTPLNVLDISERDSGSCSYQFITDLWTVDQFPYQKILLIGSDSQNTVWQRTFFFTFPTTADRISTCLNGYHDPYGQCICSNPKEWKGDYCEIPICQNGGISSYGICICVNGFYGEFCERLVTKKMA